MIKEKYEGLLNRFIEYCKISTRSNPYSTSVPSNPKEKEFQKQLLLELKNIGLKEVKLFDKNSFLLATVPSNIDYNVPTMGIIAHVDTADFNDINIEPQIVEKYDGMSDIKLGNSKYTLSPKEFPNLKNYKNNDLITTSGNTLLGADDKCGIAEIISFCEYLIKNPNIKHGKIRIAFGPDEEIGKGADLFDVNDFNADFAYTLDSREVGLMEYETFNAALATIEIQGKNVHTAIAKNNLVNAIQLANDLHNMLPIAERPENTDGRDGFFFLYKLTGDVDHVSMEYNIRDFNFDLFTRKKELLIKNVDYLNSKLDKPRIKLNITDQYFNMYEQLKKHPKVIDMARDAMLSLNITPDESPFRGGTDGSKITLMGLPTPNLFIGAENTHSRYEFASLQSMEKVIDVLLKINEINIKTNINKTL